MNETSMTLLLEQLGNLGNRLFAIESAFIDYVEKAPKPDGQWMEERLRALEEKVRGLEVNSNG